LPEHLTTKEPQTTMDPTRRDFIGAGLLTFVLVALVVILFIANIPSATA